LLYGKAYDAMNLVLEKKYNIEENQVNWSSLVVKSLNGNKEALNVK